MLRLIEVASQSETFSKRGLRKAKTNTVNSITVWMAQPGHYRVVFSLDRPPLLAVRQRLYQEALQRRRVSLSMSEAISQRPFLLRNVKVNFPSSGAPEAELYP